MLGKYPFNPTLNFKGEPLLYLQSLYYAFKTILSHILKPNSLQVTQDIESILKPKGFALTKRGTIAVKGKGDMVRREHVDTVGSMLCREPLNRLPLGPALASLHTAHIPSFHVQWAERTNVGHFKAQLLLCSFCAVTGCPTLPVQVFFCMDVHFEGGSSRRRTKK
jgi:hypothetical protein